MFIFGGGPPKCTWCGDKGYIEIFRYDGTSQHIVANCPQCKDARAVTRRLKELGFVDTRPLAKVIPFRKRSEVKDGKKDV